MTRKEYMDHPDRNAAHRAYHGQFVNPAYMRRVVDTIGADKIKRSTDPHFNDIPLDRWDLCRLSPLQAQQLKEQGDWYTMAGQVCIAKEAARQYLEGLEA